MEKTLVQLPLFQEDSLASHSQLLEKEKAKMTTDTCGTKLLELLPSANRNGLLEKMLTALLTSPKVQSCDRYKTIWKKRVSKSNVLLFQLAASVLGIKEKESGSSDIMYPTPRSCDLEGGVVKNVELKNGSFSRLNKKGIRFGVKLKDAVHKMTPQAGGKLNPNFVEFLMGYPMNYTQIEPTESKHSETQSCHKSQNKSSGVS